MEKAEQIQNSIELFSNTVLIKSIWIKLISFSFNYWIFIKYVVLKWAGFTQQQKINPIEK